jgi:putative transposase
VHSFLIFIKQMTSMCLQSLHHRFVDWTKPSTTSLLLGTVADQARSKSELVAENALLRQQLLILRRQVKRPACTKTDRMLLLLCWLFGTSVHKIGDLCQNIESG